MLMIIKGSIGGFQASHYERENWEYEIHSNFLPTEAEAISSLKKMISERLLKLKEEIQFLEKFDK